MLQSKKGRLFILSLLTISSSLIGTGDHDRFLALTALKARNSQKTLPSSYLYHSPDGFRLVTPKGSVEINRWDMDKELRGISQQELNQRMNAGSYLQLKKLSHDEYALHLQSRLNGGGAWGAWLGATVAKATVSVVGHGSIVLISGAVGLINPAAGVATGIALESTCGAAIEAASMAAAVAGGIAGGVGTGPV